MMALTDRLKEAMKQAMRAKDKHRLGTIRMALAAIKQIEVDERVVLDDAGVIAVLTKMVKQRRDAMLQFSEAGRPELAQAEAAEIEVIEDFLPQPLTPQAINEMIQQVITELNANGMKDMGKVMAKLKSALQGKADMAVVSGLVKARLTAAD